MKSFQKRGSTLLITLLIVTLMVAASVGAASISFVNLGTSIAYADAQIARDAAEGGIADVLKRLQSPEYLKNPSSLLINLDTGKNYSLADKKAPNYRYYSLAYGNNIKTLGRCTKVAVVSPWDQDKGTYLTPSNSSVVWDIFSKINNAFKDPDRTPGNRSGILGFQHPLTPKGATGKAVYKNEEPDYWLVKMGGPLDQADPSKPAKDILAAAKQTPNKYLGLFSHPAYFNYDLLYLPLPASRTLRLDDTTKMYLEAWLKKGGRLWIDNSTLSGLANAPFSTASGEDPKYGTSADMGNYKFSWDYNDITENATLKSGYNLSDTEYPWTLRDDVWVLNDAFKQGSNVDSTPAWEKETVSGGKQSISGEYQVWHIRSAPTVNNPKPLSGTSISARAVTYPGSDYESSLKAIDKSGNRIWLKYGSTDGLAVGDGIKVVSQVWNNTDKKVVSGAVSATGWISAIGKDSYVECNGCNFSSFKSHFGSSIDFTNINGPGTTLGSGDLGPGLRQDVQVDNTDRFAVGDVIKITKRAGGTGGPLWGLIKDIDYAAKTLKVDLHGGPTPRQGHNLIYNENPADPTFFVFGGYDLSTNSNQNNYFSIDDTNDATAPWGVNMAPQARNDVWKLFKEGGVWKWQIIKDNMSLKSSQLYSDISGDGIGPARRAYAVGAFSPGDPSTRDDDRIVIATGETDPSSRPIGDAWMLKDVYGNDANWEKVVNLGEIQTHICGSPAAAEKFTQQIKAHAEPNIYVTNSSLPQAGKENEVNIKVRDYTPQKDGQIYGLSLGDELRITSIAGDYRRLEGTLDSIKNLSFTPGAYPVTTATLVFRSLKGAEIKAADGLTGPGSVTVMRHKNKISQISSYYKGDCSKNDQVADISKGADGIAYGDTITFTKYYSGIKDEYWGLVSGTNAADNSKSVSPIYKGPPVRTHAGGAYFSPKDEFYVFGGRSMPTGRGGKTLGDMWKISQAARRDPAETPAWLDIDNKGQPLDKTKGTYDVSVISNGSVYAVGPAKAINNIDRTEITLQAGSTKGIAIGDQLRINGSKYYQAGKWLNSGGPLFGIVTGLDGNKITFSQNLTGTKDIDDNNAGWTIDLGQHRNERAPKITYTGKIDPTDSWDGTEQGATMTQYFNTTEGLAVGDILEISQGENNGPYYVEVDSIADPACTGNCKIDFFSIPYASPVERQGFAASFDYVPSADPNKPTRSNLMIFGGAKANGDAMNDVWVADLLPAISKGNPIKWKRWKPNGPSDGGGTPKERSYLSTIYDAGSNKLVAYGGTKNDYMRMKFDSIWTLNNANGKDNNGNGNPATPRWSRTTQQPTNTADGLSGRQSAWPDGRSGQATVAANVVGDAEPDMVMFGGISFPATHGMHPTYNALADEDNLPSDSVQLNPDTRKNVNTADAGLNGDGTYLGLKHPFFNTIYDRNAPDNGTLKSYWQSNARRNSTENLGYIRSLSLGLSNGRNWVGESALTTLGSNYSVLTTYPKYPRANNYGIWNNEYEDNYGIYEDKTTDPANAQNVSSLVATAFGRINKGMLLLTSNNVGGGISAVDKYYDEEQGEDTAFIFNAIVYFQTQNRVRVTGYYGGVARAFVVTYDADNGVITDISEVAAEQQ